jgi:hypothetical protein
MAVSPIVEVQDGGGPWVGTTGGVNVTPGNTISIRLPLPVDPATALWSLQIFGVDEVTATAPPLTDVNPATHVVTNPSTTVTFVMPAGAGIGRAIIFRSIVNGSLQATFGIYTLTSGRRVGAVGERIEGDPNFGWAAILNPLIRSGGGFSAGGDLSGTSASQTVVGLQGRTLDSSAPSGGDVIAWDAGSSQWEPTPPASGFTAGGDLSGTPTDQTVIGLQGNEVSASAPSGGNALVWNSGTSQWEPVALYEEMITPALSVTLTKTAPVGGLLLFRRGDAIGGITATAAYVSGPPASASIANSFGGSVDAGDVDPGVWTLPGPAYTSGTLAGYVLRSGADLGTDPYMIATLTASKGIPRTSSFTLVWSSDILYGHAAAGLNTQAGLAPVLTAVLTPNRTGTFSTSPSNDKVYYCYPKGRGTSTFTLSGFPAAFNAPIEVAFTNVNGVLETYYVYESTNLLTGVGLDFVVS